MRYTVSSNGSLGFFPANGRTHFTNVVPHSLQADLSAHELSFVRVRKIGLARRVAAPPQRETVRRRRYSGYDVTYRTKNPSYCRLDYYMCDDFWHPLPANPDLLRHRLSQMEPEDLSHDRPPPEGEDSFWEDAPFPESRLRRVTLRLGQIDRDLLSGGDAAQVLGEFFIDPADRDSDYFVHEFDHSPWLKIMHSPLRQLTVELLDSDGELLQMDPEEEGEEGERIREGWQHRTPTVVVLEIGHRRDLAFGMTCSSRDDFSKQVYLSNRGTRFSVRLPAELSLAGYEVAVSQIVYPSHVLEAGYAVLRIFHRDEVSGELLHFNFFYNVEAIHGRQPDRRSLLAAMNTAFNHHPALRRKTRWTVAHGEGGVVCLRVLPSEGCEMTVQMNRPLLSLLGLRSHPEEGYMSQVIRWDASTPVPLRQTLIRLGSRPDIEASLRLCRTSALTYIHADFVELSGWNGEMVPLLAVLQSPEYLREGETCVEPTSLSYRPVKQGRLSHLRLTLCREDGEENPFQLVFDHPFSVVVRLLFRPAQTRQGP